jgi:hypothetical protein
LYITIYKPVPGDYQVTGVGRGTGPYKITVARIGEVDAGESPVEIEREITGNAEPGVAIPPVVYPVEGVDSGPDLTPPVVTAPAPISVTAEEPGGIRGGSAALAAFLAGGSASDDRDPAPTRLAPQLGAIDIVATTLIPLGDSTITFRFRDAAGNVGTATSTITVNPPPDTTAPVVEPPAAISVTAEEPGGIRGGSPALALFLAGGTATDDRDPAPIRLAPQIAGTDIVATTLIPVGVTSITFRFRDAAGNIGTAESSVTVNPFPVPVCATNVTADVSISASGFRLNRTTGKFEQTVTVRGVAQVITGPLVLALDGLSPTATVVGAPGVTGCAAPAGSPFVVLNVGADGRLNIGEASKARIAFDNPTRARITYVPRILSGTPR